MNIKESFEHNNLIYIIFVLIVLLVFAFGVNTILNLQRAINNVAESILEDTSLIVEEKVQDYFEPFTIFDTFMAHSWDRDLTFKENAENVEIFARSIVGSFSQLTSIQIGDKNGNFVMFRKYKGKQVNTKLIDTDVEPNEVMWKFYSGKMVQVISTSNRIDYDPRTRPWYIGAMNASGNFFTEPYAFFTDGEMGITAARTMHSDRATFGVYSYDITIADLKKFLDGLNVIGNGEVFIITDENNAIFGNRANYFSQEGSNTLTESFWTSVDNFKNEGDEKQVIKSGGREFVLKFRTIRLGHNQNWTLGVAVAVENYQAVLGISATFLMVIFVIVILLITLIIYYKKKKKKTDIELEKHIEINRFKKLMYLPNLESAFKIVYNDFLLNGNNFVLVRCDMDNFKAMVEMHGLDITENILMEIASILAVQLRRTDYICRWEEDDFVILLSDATSDRGYNIAEKLRKTIEHYQYHGKNKVIKCTVSIGIAEPHQDLSLNDMLDKALENLMVAKATGKNKTIK